MKVGIKHRHTSCKTQFYSVVLNWHIMWERFVMRYLNALVQGVSFIVSASTPILSPRKPPEPASTFRDRCCPQRKDRRDIGLYPSRTSKHVLSVPMSFRIPWSCSKCEHVTVPLTAALQQLRKKILSILILNPWSVSNMIVLTVRKANVYFIQKVVCT